MQVADFFCQVTNCFAVLCAALYVSLGVGNLKLALQVGQLLINASSILYPSSLPHTLLTKQLTLLDDFPRHGRLPFCERNIGVGDALTAINIQRLRLFHESSHGVSGSLANGLRLQLCLTCSQLFFAHCLETLGHLFDDQVALTGGQPGQRCAGLNKQPRLVGVLQQVLNKILPCWVVCLCTGQLHALGGICGRDRRNAGTLSFLGFAALFAWHNNLLLVVTLKVRLRKLCGLVADRLCLLQHVLFGSQPCHTLLLQCLLVQPRLLQAGHVGGKLISCSFVGLQLLVDAFVERFVLGLGRRVFGDFANLLLQTELLLLKVLQLFGFFQRVLRRVLAGGFGFLCDALLLGGCGGGNLFSLAFLGGCNR